MPAVFTSDGFRFYFYSNEGSPREPMHIHAAKRGAGEVKLWLYPEVRMAYNYGFDARTERWVLSEVRARRVEIESAWHEHFGTGD